MLRVYDHQVRISIDGMETERFDCADPLAFVEEFKARYQVPTVPGLPRFDGGLVGYFGYDCVRYVENAWPPVRTRTRWATRISC